MNSLIIWNNTKYAQTLSSYCGKENVITNSRNLQTAITNWETYDGLVVLCELKWDINGVFTNLQALSGIDLVKDLRREYNITIPALFVSFQSLINAHNAEREILTAIGHSYCSLPVNPNEFASFLKGVGKLTETELKDVQLFSCSPKGIVSMKIHQIQGVLNHFDKDNAALKVSEVKNCIIDIHSVYKVDASGCLSLFDQKFPVITKDNISKALRFVEEVGKDLIDTYSSDSSDNGNSSAIRKPWTLLLLDDELDKDSAIVQLLDKKGVTVICTSNAEEAMKVLTKDDKWRGKISLILTDYRLYENKGIVKVQQKIQGYTFLQKVGQEFKSKLISAIVYSGMPRQFLLDTFRTFRIRTEIFSKIDFKLDDTGARNFLMSRIIETGDTNYEAMLALPLSNSGWRDYLHDTYLLFRSQPDYDIREREICNYCEEWVEKFRKGENPETPMIKGDTFNAGKQESETDKLQRFEAFYKTRRLAQYLNLFFENRKEPDIQGSIIKLLAKYAKPTSYRSDVSKRRFFSQTLGFKREEYPFGATIEELCWLHYDMGIEILNSYTRYRTKLLTCESLFGDFILGLKTLEITLKKSNYKYISDRDHELNFNPDNCYPYLFDKLDLGLCLEWLGKQKETFNYTVLQEFQNLLNEIRKLWI